MRRLNTSYGVSQNRWRLSRLRHCEERLMTTLAGWIWSEPVLEDKIEMARLAYEGALAADQLRRRADELFPPTADPERPLLLADLDILANEIANAPAHSERLAGLAVFRRALLGEYQTHLAATDDLIDGPTAALLKGLIATSADHLTWVEARLAGLGEPEAGQTAMVWAAHIEGLTAALGGLAGADHAVALPTLRDASPPARHLPGRPARDGRFNIVPVAEYLVTSMGTEPADIIRHLLYQNTYGEMEAGDLLGRVLADAPELPWPMRLDLVRQLWDEARHAEMSWRRMLELGGPPAPLPKVTTLIHEPMLELTDPLERLLVLQRVIEGRVTERHRYRVHYLARELGDQVTARLFEYIVADERAHVGYSDWIPRLLGDDPERLARLDRVHATAERLFESILTRRLDQTAGMKRAKR